MPRSRCGKLAGKRISQHQRAGTRQQAGLPRICHETAVGSLLASEYPNTRGPEFASKLVSHGSATKPLWEACWQANIPTPEGRNSPASWSPTDLPRNRCGKLAGKRISQHQRAGIRQQAGLPRICHEAAVGSLLASEYPNTRGPEFASKLVSHGSATKPLWEACWQANIPTPEGRNSPASWSPTDLPRSRCGKLAGKRISQHQRAGIRQQAGLPRICHEAAVGSGPGGAPLGRECPEPLAIRLPASFPQRRCSHL